MRSRRRVFEVYSLSAVDLFASAMGAFIIISIILMPDYQKEVRSLGDLEYLEELAGKTQAMLDQTEQGRRDVLDALRAAQTRQRELQARYETVSSELETLEAQQQARLDQPPPPPPSPEVTEEEDGSNLVTFRFLGLKTDQKQILFLVDMNRFLAPHEPLVRESVIRAMDSLQDGYRFAILGFQQQDQGPVYYRWPEGGELAPMNDRNRADARAFMREISGKYEGSSSLLSAFDEAFTNQAGAIVLFSDGLPNPSYNNGLAAGPLVRSITVANRRQQEIHAVTLGDYFKYRGTIEFMES
ncbi:MAG: VWA domain-containing protein, partial [Gammaproteobacteria bacterium]|nr:VWA domain-containing protein [Gammaproteobacteria bacterium]MBT8049813.1 VWA domain-containing protein [Gammaproteobacteria bacterium]NNJ78857.1 VWA domain-containing protein [Xanthomonadales bacterium]